MPIYQDQILAPLPTHAQFLTFECKPGSTAKPSLQALQSIFDNDSMLVGLGVSLMKTFNCVIEGLKSMPSLQFGAITIPTSHGALWVRVSGSDPGETMFSAESVIQAVADGFVLTEQVPAFTYRQNLDLSGYEDGTENPQDDDAIKTAIIKSEKRGINGSSLVAVQSWIHDIKHLKSLPQTHQDHIIGRRLSDNEELDDAPVSAHVKRTAQESFTPEAFMWRRSLPWAQNGRCGLQFVCFATSYYPYEVQLKRMIGMEDGITDGLFEFSRPVTGAYFWCPPVDASGLDLSALI
ncbi:MAG: putative iron-dependent peroxidase [Marinobacter maritimus]|jgi:putative iron-dependent peroxidase